MDLYLATIDQRRSFWPIRRWWIVGRAFILLIPPEKYFLTLVYATSGAGGSRIRASILPVLTAQSSPAAQSWEPGTASIFILKYGF
jgi:hypothetical protein